MADDLADPAAWRQVAVGELGKHLQEHYSGAPIADTELAPYVKSRGATQGWRVSTLDADGASMSLDLFIDGGFPYTPPRLALPATMAQHDWPHVEEDRGLCLLPNDASTATLSPIAVVEHLLGDAKKLIADCRGGRLVDDLRDEFLSYWHAGPEATRSISIVSPGGPSRRISVWRDESRIVCADDRASLDGWLKQWGADSFVSHPGMLLWLPQPLLPSEYPVSGSDIRTLVRHVQPDLVSLLEELAASTEMDTTVLLGAPTANGACFAGVTLPRPKGVANRPGFRPGKVPGDLTAASTLGGFSKVRRHVVSRADRAWIHGRGRDKRQDRLSQARILVVGCGSLGSGVARLMAQAGVGNMLLLDRQVLDWANISRHALGAQSVHQFKSLALAQSLQREFPHLRGIEGRSVDLDISAASILDDLSSYDAIVTTTGRWAVDAMLGDLQRSRPTTPPIVFGWMEPHAVAAHALVIYPKDTTSCLRCGFDDLGHFSLAASEWPDDVQPLREPACGATFSPFGPIELSHATSLAADAVMDVLLKPQNKNEHRTWLGHGDRLREHGGRWSRAWTAKHGDPGEGSRTIRQPWPPSGSCHLCKSDTAA